MFVWLLWFIKLKFVLEGVSFDVLVFCLGGVSSFYLFSIIKVGNKYWFGVFLWFREGF